MTRTEALHRLRGTWRFQLRAGRVRVDDVSLLRALDAENDVANDEAGAGHGRAATTPLPG